MKAPSKRKSRIRSGTSDTATNKNVCMLIVAYSEENVNG